MFYIASRNHGKEGLFVKFSRPISAVKHAGLKNKYQMSNNDELFEN